MRLAALAAFLVGIGLVPVPTSGSSEDTYGQAACWSVPVVAVQRVIDGDTVVVRVRLWPDLEKVETVRILGVDTPEVKGPSKEAGRRATEFTRAWLDQRFREGLMLWGCRRDHFGRFLGGLTGRGGETLVRALLDAGLGGPR